MAKSIISSKNTYLNVRTAKAAAERNNHAWTTMQQLPSGRFCYMYETEVVAVEDTKQTLKQRSEAYTKLAKENNIKLVNEVWFLRHANADKAFEQLEAKIAEKKDLPKPAKAEQTKTGEATMAPKKKTTKKAPKVTLAELQAAAEDFNSFMEFEEPEGIPFDDMDEEELIEEITETAEELEATDQILQATADTLNKMGVDFEATVTEEEEEEEEDEPSDVTEEEVGKMKLAELKTLAEELEIDLGKAKTVKAVRAVILEELFPEDDEEEEVEEEEVEATVADEEEEEEEEEEVEEEATPLKGAEAKAVKAKVAEVKKLKKLDDIKAIAKEAGIRMPPPFLKDLKKLKPYVTGKLEAILSGDFVPGQPAKKKAGSGSGKKDKYGFQGGSKKSAVMKAIEESGDDGISYYDLKEEYKGQVDNAIKQSLERAGIEVEVICRIVKK